jgi:hypothetical protein
MNLFKRLFGDHTELPEPLEKKFSTIIQALNAHAFNGLGSIINRKEKSFDLYDNHSNQIIKFRYNGIVDELAIILKFKYYENELIKKYVISNAWNRNSDEMKIVRSKIISKMEEDKKHHKDIIHEQLGLTPKVDSYNEEVVSKDIEDGELELEGLYLGTCKITNPHGLKMDSTVILDFKWMQKVEALIFPDLVQADKLTEYTEKMQIKAGDADTFDFECSDSKVTMTLDDMRLEGRVKKNGLYLDFYQGKFPREITIFKNVYLKLYTYDEIQKS